jgi:hypothetical protein
MRNVVSRLCTLAIIASPALFQNSLKAQTPVANAVPFVASNPTSPHTSWSTNPVTLKGTLTSSAFGTHTFTYDWDPGDGGAHCTGTVTNQFDVECAHTYTGAVNTVFVAVLKITDTTNSLVSPASNCPPTITQGACYYTSLNPPPPNLAIEVNNAIDKGLWLLHTKMRHFTTTGGTQAGDWTLNDGSHVDIAQSGDTGPNSLNCSAFENSGFLQTNTPANPYSDDVRLCLNGVFDQLTTLAISSVNDVVYGTYNPDSNNNGIGVQAAAPNSGNVNYQTGMMLDALVASGTATVPIPAGTKLATAITGLGLKGTGAGGAYSYGDAVIDMVDDYAYCEAPSYNSFGTNYNGGGWHYTCQEETGDNSVSQWAAIGIIPAIRKFGATVPAAIHTADENWLDSSYFANSAGNGYFGYTSSSPLWGPFADTPSGLVQLAMSGLGRGKVSPGGNHLWDNAETYLRDNFANTGNDATTSMKAYYYGMFSFTKAMLLHDNNDGAGAIGTGNQPISLLQSSDDPNTCSSPVPIASPGSGAGPCYPAIDWYAAQTSAYGGTDPTNGVARTILNDQQADGSWFGQNYTGAQDYFQTGISITMLNKTVFQPVPVACFTTNPSHVASGGPVTLDGGCSVEQNPAYSLVSWQWDVSGTGGTSFTIKPGSPQCLTASCSKIIYNFTLPNGASLPYNYPVRLRVTDNASPALTADVVGNVVISSPPNPPNANAGGPYNFCPNTTVAGSLIYAPFLLDGSKSTNPDQGKTDGTNGAVPSTITAYDWDYACSGAFTSAHGAQVNATGAFDVAADFGTSFNVCLRVTNNDNLAFPSAGLAAGLSSVASAQVSIHNPTDEVCTHCVNTLGGKAKAPVAGTPGNIQLYWTDTNTSAQFTIDHYNIYRSTSASFNPYTQIAGAASSPFVSAVPVSVPAGGTLYFVDNNVVGGTTYYYRIAPATVNDTETCQGNVTVTVAISKGR